MPSVIWRLRQWSAQIGDPSFEVEIDPVSVIGYRGKLGAALLLPYKQRNPGGSLTEEPLLLSIGGWLGWQGEAAHVLSVEIPQQPVFVNGSLLRIPLRDDQVTAIELARGLGPATLHIVLNGTGSVMHVNIATNRSNPSVRSLGPESGQGNDLTIPREKWLEILKVLGGGGLRLVELPELSLPHDPVWQECLRLLDGATTKLRLGDFEGVKQDCREVVEGIATVLANQWKIPRRESFADWTKELARRMQGVWPRDKGAAGELGQLLAAIFSWASEEHHYGSKLPAKRESVFALSLAGALVEFAGEMLTVHPEPPLVQPSGTGEPRP